MLIQEFSFDSLDSISLVEPGSELDGDVIVSAESTFGYVGCARPFSGKGKLGGLATDIPAH